MGCRRDIVTEERAVPRSWWSASWAQRISSLTPQQFRVLMMLADGRLNKQIGGDLNVSEATIKAHVTAILRKLGLYRRTQAAVLAQRLLRAEGISLAELAECGGGWGRGRGGVAAKATPPQPACRLRFA